MSVNKYPPDTRSVREYILETVKHDKTLTKPQILERCIAVAPNASPGTIRKWFRAINAAFRDFSLGR